MFRLNIFKNLFKVTRNSNQIKRVSVSKHVNSQLYTPSNYIYPTNTLKNSMTEYVDLKENTLCGNIGERTKPKRLGRGRSSGLGKSSGHGNKGQGHRRNKKKYGFEGGQTPLSRRLPKYGRTKTNLKRLDYVNINRLVYFIQRKWLSCTPGKYITIKEMYDSGLVTKVRWGVKLLSKGGQALSKLKTPLFIEVTDVSKGAFDLIKAGGGMVRIKYMTRLKIREHLYPERFDLPLAEPLPPQKQIKKLENYRDFGCEVDYNMPIWVQEEFEKGRKYFEKKETRSFEELVNDTKARVKKTLPKQYKFEI